MVTDFVVFFRRYHGKSLSDCFCCCSFFLFYSHRNFLIFATLSKTFLDDFHGFKWVIVFKYDTTYFPPTKFSFGFYVILHNTNTHLLLSIENVIKRQSLNCLKTPLGAAISFFFGFGRLRMLLR